MGYKFVLIGIIGLISLLFCTSARAQYTDSTTRYLNLTSTGSINKTADGTSYLLNNGFKFGIRKKSTSLNFNNSWAYGKQNNLQTNNDFSSSLDFNLYKTIPHFFYWGLLTYNTSYSLKINNQLLTGVGVAYSIYDRPEAYFNVSNGVLFDYSDLILEDGTPELYETYRNSFRIAYKFIIGKLVTLNGMNFIQNSFSEKNDYIIKLNNSLNFKLNKWLNLTSTLDYNRYNRTQRENLLLSYGLSFERYF